MHNISLTIAPSLIPAPPPLLPALFYPYNTKASKNVPVDALFSVEAFIGQTGAVALWNWMKWLAVSVAYLYLFKWAIVAFSCSILSILLCCGALLTQKFSRCSQFWARSQQQELRSQLFSSSRGSLTTPASKQREDAGYGAYDFSSLSETTRTRVPIGLAVIRKTADKICH